MTELLDYMDEAVLNTISDSDRDALSGLKIELANPEINIEKMATRLGCKVKYDYLFSEIGNYNEETKEITVNLFDPEYRQRFTLAHELAHHLLGHKGMNYRAGDFDEYDVDYILRERKVNRLAAIILMPEKIIEYILDNIEIKEDMVKFFAEKFNVSYSAMEYRLKSLRKI